MHPPARQHPSFSRLTFRLLFTAVILSPVVSPSPFAAEAQARPPRAERVANRIAERRYARLSIAEARATRAEARVAEIAPAVPVPPPPRPATVRRLRRAGVPLGGPTTPVVVAEPRVAQPRGLARQPGANPAVAATQPTAQPAQATATPPRPAPSATAARPVPPVAITEPGVWTLDPDEGIAPAAAEVAPDGTRSVLSAGGSPPAPNESPEPATPAAGPAVTQPPVELLPTPEAK